VASAEEIQLADRKIERQKERLDKLQGERDLCLARHRELVFSRPTITEKRDRLRIEKTRLEAILSNARSYSDPEFGLVLPPGSIPAK
jgi:hypothetical protein